MNSIVQGQLAHQQRATAITRRMPVVERRGARVTDTTRFRDALEGLEPRHIRAARRMNALRERSELAARSWAAVAALGVLVWCALWCVLARPS